MSIIAKVADDKTDWGRFFSRGFFHVKRTVPNPTGLPQSGSPVVRQYLNQHYFESNEIRCVSALYSN